jgi:hypothetical protein
VLTRRLVADPSLSGISAVLLPYRADGTIDWRAFEAHLLRTHRAGLSVAVRRSVAARTAA